MTQTTSMKIDSNADVAFTDTKKKVTGIKDVKDLAVRIEKLEEIFSYLRNRKLKQKDEFPADDEMFLEMDEVVFKIHTKGYFEYDPLRYVNESVHCVSSFTRDKDVFQQCLNHIMSEIDEPKWALIYCKPKKSLENGLKLLHTDNDVHSFIDVTVKNGSINLVKTKIRNRKKTSVIHDEGDDRKKSMVTRGRKGKDKVIEDEGICSKGSKADVTIYKRAMVNGKAKMVEDVGAVKRGKDRGIVIEDGGFINDGGKETVVTIRAIESRKMEGKSVKVCRLTWWSLNNGVACLSTSIIWLINKYFGNISISIHAAPNAMNNILKCPSWSVSMYVTVFSLASFKL
nr:pentatricopeptide repeat-containing protein [Tanacetum cinerariifolium]GEX59076.1 pentatricopeptide repeat-containing protein [Tanacetum cinerariifolium]